MTDVNVSKHKLIRWVDRENLLDKLASKIVHKYEDGYQ